MTTINTTVPLLQAVHRAITGVVTATDVYRPNIEAADCPCVIVIPSGGTNIRPTANQLRETIRTYLVRVYVAPVGSGVGIDEAWASTATLIQRFVEKYLDTSVIPLASGAVQVTIWTSTEQPITDGGFAILTYPPNSGDGPQFYGFEIALPIVEKW